VVLGAAVLASGRLHRARPRADQGTAPASSRTQAYGRAIDERVTFLRAGVDGLFTDNPDVGVLARELA